jgi:hypothetical protein
MLRQATVDAMKAICRQIFVVVEGADVVGSFVTLKDALQFRVKSGNRSTRIVADHGETELARSHRAIEHEA